MIDECLANHSLKSLLDKALRGRTLKGRPEAGFKGKK